MFKTLEDKLKAQMSEENLSKDLQNAIGYPVTVTMSLQPINLRATEQGADSIPQSHPAECSHSWKNQRAPIHRGNIHIASSADGQMKHHSACQVSSPQRERSSVISISAQKMLSFSEFLSQENQLGTPAYRGKNGLSAAARARSLRVDYPKHRWLSLSSIPQSDALASKLTAKIYYLSLHTGIGRASKKKLETPGKLP